MLIQSKQSFHFKPPISIEGSWMLGLPSLEVYTSIFIITEENKKFELLTDTFEELSFTELKDNLRKSLIFHILHHIISNMKK